MLMYIFVHFLISQGSAATDFKEMWQILYRLTLQFITDCNSERIIEIGISLADADDDDDDDDERICYNVA